MRNLKFLIGAALLASGVTASAQAFSKGDVVADLNIGVGVANTTDLEHNAKTDSYTNEKATKGLFTQRLGVEFGIYNIDKKSSLGLGFSFLNAVGSTAMTTSGSYDYDYVVTTYEKGNRNSWWPKDTRTQNRAGTASANAKATLVDFTAMVRVAYHYSFMEKLDTYLGVGFGVSRMSYGLHDFTDTEGLGYRTEVLDKNHPLNTQLVYSYNDADHVKWSNGGSEGRFAAAVYLGARYYLTDNWGIQAELGLPNATCRRDANNYSIFSIGASYKF